jgi:hypothetical protein
MTLAPNYLRASHAELGDLYAAWAPGVEHVEPGVRSSRFAARLAPFPCREDAERALLEAGAVFEPEAAR